MLFADESGTHGGSHAFVVGGLAVHEQDAQSLQRALNHCVERGLRLGQIDEYELHAAEMRNAKTSKGPSRTMPSPWAFVDRTSRLAILTSAYRVLSTFRASSPDYPMALFGVVLDRRFHSDWSVFERERFAYEVLLNKFDAMLRRIRSRSDTDNRGLVIHDRRVVAERDIQDWTREWQKAAGSVGQLHNLADVPLFADSRASRLIQAADLISYALYRHYDPDRRGVDYLETLWDYFDSESGQLHGCVHFTPSFAGDGCPCRPCSARLGSHLALQQPDRLES
jgi:Protein of unknown function (DUF3800)